MDGSKVKSYTPTMQEIVTAHQAFEANEPRDLFYRVATELVDLSLNRATSLSVAEALAVLLQTWNQAFYRYKRFDDQHFLEIDGLLADHQQALAGFRHQPIESFCDGDEPLVGRVFGDFERVLGPVGAAKCLHLLAPRFFPLWDRAIAKAYGVALVKKGNNASRYCRFIRITKEQSHALGGEQTIGRNPLKAIDEFNYSKYTKRWA